MVRRVTTKALDLPGLRGDRLARLADELDWALVKADQRPLRVGLLGIEIEHILQCGLQVLASIRRGEIRRPEALTVSRVPVPAARRNS